MADIIDISTAKKRAVTLQDGGGNDTFDGMSDLNTRLSRIEGSWGVFQWACAVITALFFAAFAILLTVQIFTAAQVSALSDSTTAKISALSDKVDGLPDKINQNLLQLNQTLSTAITASKNQPPTVIVLPTPNGLPIETGNNKLPFSPYIPADPNAGRRSKG